MDNRSAAVLAVAFPCSNSTAPIHSIVPMKWRNACKQKAYNRRRAVEKASAAAATANTHEAAAALSLLLCSDSGALGRAHAEDVDDPLEDDVPCVREGAEEHAHFSLTTDANAAIIPSTLLAADACTLLATVQAAQHDATRRQNACDLEIRRWSIVRQQPDLLALREAWWERCGVSASIVSASAMQAISFPTTCTAAMH